MERSLTVLLPVHNAQATLAARVVQLLEVVSELTGQFEMVIVDDGSNDATSEVAHELTRDYPQIMAVGHDKRMGREAAIRTGLQHSRGEMILLCDGSFSAAIDGIARLWWAAGSPRAVPESSATAADSRRTRFSGGHQTRPTGYQLIDRQTLQQRHSLSRPARPNYLARFMSHAPQE